MKNLLSYVITFAAAVQVASSSPVGPFGSDVSTPPSDALTSAPPSASPALAARPSRSSDASTSAPPSSSTLAAPASENDSEEEPLSVPLEVAAKRDPEWETKMERVFIMWREEVKGDLEDAKDILELKAIKDDPEWETTMENLERMLPNLSLPDVERAFKVLQQYVNKYKVDSVALRGEKHRELESRKQNKLAIRYFLRYFVKEKQQEALGKRDRYIKQAGYTREGNAWIPVGEIEALLETQKDLEIADYCSQQLDIRKLDTELDEGLKGLPPWELPGKFVVLEDARRDQLRKELGLPKPFLF